MRHSETTDNIINPPKLSKENEKIRGKEKIDSWIDDIIKQHKKQLDDIKKNRAIDEKDETFSFRDKNFMNSHLIDKSSFNASKIYVEKNQENKANTDKTISSEIAEKIKKSTNQTNILSNNLNTFQIAKSEKFPDKMKQNLINIRKDYVVNHEKFKYNDFSKDESIKPEQRRSKSNANVEISLKSFEDEYSHLDQINPILSPNNNHFLQTEFNSIEMTKEDEDGKYSNLQENKLIRQKNAENSQKNNYLNNFDLQIKNINNNLTEKIEKEVNNPDMISNSYSKTNNIPLNDNNIFESINNTNNIEFNKLNTSHYSNFTNEKNKVENSPIDQNNGVSFPKEENKREEKYFSMNKIPNNENEAHHSYDFYKKNQIDYNNFGNRNNTYNKLENLPLKSRQNTAVMQNLSENYSKNSNLNLNIDYNLNSNYTSKYDTLETSEKFDKKEINEKSTFLRNAPKKTIVYTAKKDQNENETNENRYFLENSERPQEKTLDKIQINQNSNNSKKFSFLHSESMLSKNINKQKSNLYTSDNDCKIYQRHFSTITHVKDSYNNDSSFEELKNLENIVYIRSKLDAKKTELKDLKKQYQEISSSYSTLRVQVEDLENYRNLTTEKLKNYESIIESSESKYLVRESEMLNKIKNLEEDKAHLEEKLVKFTSEEKFKGKEMELLNQKVKDMEIIIEENENEHINTIKFLKIENEEIRGRNSEFEKLVDIFSYFFKKIQTYYQQKNQFNKSENSSFDNSDFNGDCTKAQNKLIELENFIIQLLKEKGGNFSNSQFNQKQTDDYYNNPALHYENIKTLNEKIFDLTDENNYLKQELQRMQSLNNFSINKNNFSGNNPHFAGNSTQMNTLEINKSSKEKELKNSFEKNHHNIQYDENFYKINPINSIESKEDLYYSTSFKKADSKDYYDYRTESPENKEALVNKKNYLNNLEMVKNILEKGSSPDNKKYNFDYYSKNNYIYSNNDQDTGYNRNFINNTNNLNNLNFNENLNNFENDRNSSPCFINVDKYNQNEGRKFDEYNTFMKKDTGMSFKKITDRENIFKQNYNNAIENLPKKKLNINTNEINQENEIGKSENLKMKKEEKKFEEEKKSNEIDDSYVSKVNSKNSCKIKNSTKFNNIVNFKREKSYQSQNFNSTNSGNQKKSTEKSNISKKPLFNNEDMDITNNSNTSHISIENSTGQNLNLKVLEMRIKELENQLNRKENNKHKYTDDNSFENISHVQNTTNSNYTITNENIFANKNNFKKDYKKDEKASKNVIKGNTSLSSKSSKPKITDKNDKNLRRKNSLRNNEKENISNLQKENRQNFNVHMSDNYNTIHNKIPKNNPPIIRQKSAPKNLISNNSKSTEKKVIYSYINNSGNKNNSKFKK